MPRLNGPGFMTALNLLGIAELVPDATKGNSATHKPAQRQTASEHLLHIQIRERTHRLRELRQDLESSTQRRVSTGKADSATLPKVFRRRKHR